MILIGVLLWIAMSVVLYVVVAFLWDLLAKNPFKKKEEKPYLDNSEYDYGHNVKHYMEEEL